MSVSSYTDRFIRNLIVSGLVACWTVLAVFFFAPDLPALDNAAPAIVVAVVAGVAAFILLSGPVLLGQVPSARRSIFRDPETDQAAWRGRLIGLVLGLLLGIAVQGI